MATDAEEIVGTWTVKFRQFTWEYTFSDTKQVKWLDANSQRSGSGTWEVDSSGIKIIWQGSTTKEHWDGRISDTNTGSISASYGSGELISTRKKPTADGSVSKAKFLERCNAAVNRLQVLDFKFRAWLSTISDAYAQAFKAHEKFRADIKSTKEIGDTLLLGFATAFLGGAVGGVVGGVMKKAQASDFMIDGVKDIAKFAVRGPAAAAYRARAVTSKMPTSPFQWNNALSGQAAAELAVVSATIFDWRVSAQATEVDQSFDPLKAVEESLHIDFDGKSLDMNDLPELDSPALQKDFEKGFFVGWLTTVAENDVTRMPVLRNNTQGQILIRGRALGVKDIDDLVEKHVPIFVD